MTSAVRIVSIGTSRVFGIESLQGRLEAIRHAPVAWLQCASVAEAMDHFFSAEPVQLLLIDEHVDGLVELVTDLKSDELFQYLPMVLLLERNTAEQRKNYASLGIEHVLQLDCDDDELLMACASAMRYKIQLDTVVERLRVVTEENITRAIQLDVIRRFLPLTVWQRSELVAAEQEFELDEAEEERAIVFGDVKAFTTRAETLTPPQVIALLNRLFGVATRIVYAWGGDIDKFIGDAFFAVFPTSSTAIQAALEIQSELARVGTQESPQFRIGIHWGRVIRGSVGGNLRWDHTLIGDVVNTAQRLEANATPGTVLVSRAALEVEARPLADDIVFTTYHLKGKGVTLEAAEIRPGMPVWKDTPAR